MTINLTELVMFFLYWRNFNKKDIKLELVEYKNNMVKFNNEGAFIVIKKCYENIEIKVNYSGVIMETKSGSIPTTLTIAEIYKLCNEMLDNVKTLYNKLQEKQTSKGVKNE